MNHIPYKGSGTLASRPDGRPRGSLVPGADFGHLAHQSRQAQADRHIRRGTRVRACPMCRRSPSAVCRSFATGGWFGHRRADRHAKICDRQDDTEMASILATPDTQDYLVKQGSEAFVSTPDEVTALIKADVRSTRRSSRTPESKANRTRPLERTPFRERGPERRAR